jgi:hypothetical protein
MRSFNSLNYSNSRTHGNHTQTNPAWCMQPVGYPPLLYTDRRVLCSSCALFYGVLNTIARSSARYTRAQVFPNQYIHSWIWSFKSSWLQIEGSDCIWDLQAENKQTLYYNPHNSINFLKYSQVISCASASETWSVPIITWVDDRDRACLQNVGFLHNHQCNWQPSLTSWTMRQQDSPKCP